MTIGEMLAQGGLDAVLGVGLLTLFLGIIIFAIKWMSKADNKSGIEKDAYQPAPSVSVTGTPQQVAAAITAAVNEFQKNEKRNCGFIRDRGLIPLGGVRKVGLP